MERKRYKIRSGLAKLDSNRTSQKKVFQNIDWDPSANLKNDCTKCPPENVDQIWQSVDQSILFFFLIFIL